MTLYNRGDNRHCFADRLSNATVWISTEKQITTENAKKCGQVGDASKSTKIDIECKEGIVGRYVLVVGIQDVLSLCEVQVWGRK